MTRVILAALLAVVASPVSIGAQGGQKEAPAPGGEFRPLASALELTTMLDRRQWDLVAQSKRTDTLKSAKTAVADLATYARTETVEIANRDAVRKYEAPLADTITALNQAVESLRFVYLHGDVPILFATKDQALGVVVSGVVSTKTYNTLRLSATERAAAVVRDVILPSLKAFAAFGKFPEVSFYGLAVVYGSRDLSAQAPSVAESVTFVVPADACRRFTAGDLTAGALFDVAEVYLSDRDMVGGVRKVTLTVK